MQEHPLNAIYQLTSAQVASQGKLLGQFVAIPGLDTPLLFQKDAIRLPTGWLQTPCDTCEATIQFKVAKDDLLAVFMRGISTQVGLVHPEFGAASVKANEAFCAKCQGEWDNAVITYYEEVQPKLASRPAVHSDPRCVTCEHRLSDGADGIECNHVLCSCKSKFHQGRA